MRVIERPEDLRGDFVSTNKIFAYDLTQSDADIYVQTHATNPLLKAETIGRAIQVFLDHEDEYDSVFSANAFHSRFYFEDGRPVNHDPENLIRTQDLPPLYEENSCLYVFTAESFAKKSRRIGLQPMMLQIARIEAIDIDDDFTFRLAELLGLYAQQEG